MEDEDDGDLVDRLSEDRRGDGGDIRRDLELQELTGFPFASGLLVGGGGGDCRLEDAEVV